MKKTILIFAAILIFGYGCKKSDPSDCFKSTGKVMEESRDVGFFNKIVLYDNVNLHLTQGNTNQLTVKAGKNLMKKIVTETNGDSTLKIANLNSCNFIRSYKIPVDVYLTFTNLWDIEYHSVGTVDNTDTLRLDSLQINVREGGGDIRLCVNAFKLSTNLHNGTATMECSGKTGLLFVYSGEFGLIDNRNLSAHMVYLRTKSSNDVYIRATHTLMATIMNIGNVYYYGNPSVLQKDGAGSGALIRAGE